MTAAARKIDIVPRGLNRAQAAAYIGVSPGTFDKMVADERMPAPRCINARRLWDIRELDAAFDDLPHAPIDGQDGAGQRNGASPLDGVASI
jgi:predicted DNA-binding transcriptional regulator AlpA